MKTIEERYGCSNCQCPSCEGCSIWDKVEGATEQKAIDIDKACEWLRENVRPYYKFSIESFRKAMEE